MQFNESKAGDCGFRRRRNLGAAQPPGRRMKCRWEQQGWRGLARYLKKKHKKQVRLPQECWVFLPRKLMLPVYACCTTTGRTHSAQGSFCSSKMAQKEMYFLRDPKRILWKRRFRAALDNWSVGNSPNSCRRLRQLFFFFIFGRKKIGCTGLKFICGKQSRWMDGQRGRQAVEIKANLFLFLFIFDIGFLKILIVLRLVKNETVEWLRCTPKGPSDWSSPKRFNVAWPGFPRVTHDPGGARWASRSITERLRKCNH